MFFNKPSILAATLAILASGVASQIIEVCQYPIPFTSQDKSHNEKPSPEGDPVLRGVSGSREIPTMYIDGVYCCTGQEQEQ
ncbi:hypothetical protein RIB2604_00700720 [Aspergillus luchuensis]|uniref:Uncharacterized protein n=1 Tax=Aspergillus kawachii TaxID=1069201 RepID=A0A146F2K8_ASPKA|nr:hypothetical protein RIB2604_00700720 [Aspergillus luchuensis]